MTSGPTAVRLALATPPIAAARRTERRVFDAATESVPAARQFVRAVLRSWQRDEFIEAGALLVSELVGNAVLHAGSEVSVEVIDDGGAVILTVVDGSSVLPVVRRNSRTSSTGRGLWLLDQYSADRGVELTDGGKRIWAVLCPDVPFSADAPEEGLSAWLDALEAL